MGTERIQIVISQSGARPVANDIDSLGKKADRASSSLGGLGAALKALVAGAVVRETLRIADSYTSMGNRIRTVTKSADEFKDVQNELFRIAQRTRAPLDGITEGYSRLAISTQRLGLSQKETMQFTESLSQAMAIGGAGAQEQASAMRQLGQALGTGALKSDEFNSVMENAPVVMEIIAKGMRVQVGDLKTLAGQGKITSEVIVNAFKEARFELEGRFGTAVVTAGSAISGPLMNSITRLVGEVDQATGGTRGLAEAIVELSEDIEKATPTVTLLVKELTDLSALKMPEVDFIDQILGGVSKMQALTLGLVGIKETLIAIANAGMNPIRLAAELQLAGDRFAKFRDELAGVGAPKLGKNFGLPFNMIEDSESRLGPLKPQITIGGGSAAAGKKKPGETFGSVMAGLQREHQLLEMTNNERQIAEGLDRARSQVQSGLTSQQLAMLEYQLRENQLLEVANDSIDRRLKEELELMEIEKERENAISKRLGEEVERGMNAAAASGGLRPRDFETTSALMGQEQIAQMRTFGEEMAAIFGPGGSLEQGMGGIGRSLTDIIGQSIAFGASWKDTQQAVEMLGRSIIAEVISSLIRIPIQLAINEAIASGLRAKATAETVAQAGATTAAMAPAAAATSLATAGGNSIGATAAIIGVSALAAGVLAMAAFEEGGYTGRGSRKRVAGVVHGDEFVLNSAATHRVGVDNLERINAGGGLGGGSKLRVYLINQATGVQHDVRQVDEHTVEVIARRILASDGPGVIADDMMSAHGKTKRAVTSATTARTRR
jgi:tape measure domain-containing protein